MAENSNIPFTLLLHFITRDYFGALTHLMGHAGIERHFYPLLLIAERGDGLTQRELAEVLEVDKVTMSRITDYLVEHGMVERCTHHHDRRTILLTATSAGLKLAPQIKAAFEMLDRASFSGISREEENNFLRTARTIRESMRSIPKDNVLFEYQKLINPEK